LTLADARALALQNNPTLKSADAEWRATQGAVQQARSLINPSIGVRREDFGGSSPPIERAEQDTLELSQTIRTGGKRSAEIEAARWASEVSLQDLGRRRLDLLADVDRRFAELLGAQDRCQIASENAETAQEMVAAVAALVEAGETSPIEVSRTENERDLAEIDRQAALRNRDLARRQLASLLGQAEPGFQQADGSLVQEVVVPAESDFTIALGRLPDLTRWDDENRRLEASLKLAQRTPWPDLTLSAGVRRYAETQERAYLVGISIPIPIFSRGRGAVIEASSRLDQGRLQREAEEMRLKTTFASIRLMLEQSASEVQRLRDRVVPNAQQIYDALSEGYRRGKFRLLDLLEARRSLASTRLRYVDALVRLNLAKADLDRLSVAGSSITDGVAP
jgi:cobalt-zinc-cadmium efflux system outer membrane protein